MSALPAVCVQGLGFVGAAMALAVASARDADGRPRYRVIGVDLDTDAGRQRIEPLNQGRFPFRTLDQELTEAAVLARDTGNLRATSDPASFAEADVILIDVNLDVEVDGPAPSVDLNGFREAVRSVGQRMSAGTLVVVETTVPPGTCEHVVAPALREALRERGLESCVLEQYFGIIGRIAGERGRERGTR